MKGTRWRRSQYAEKLPATSPDRMFSEGPPSFDDVTTSLTCRDSVEVNTFTSSGMIAPASVPQDTITPSFQQSLALMPSVGIVSFETMKVSTTETIEVIQTSDVS